MVPDLTHLQFLVLCLLMNSRTGRELRAELGKHGQKKSLAAFYQLMSRMEDAEMVRGWYKTKVVDGQTIKERHYEISANGVRCWEDARAFYLRASGLTVEGA